MAGLSLLALGVGGVGVEEVAGVLNGDVVAGARPVDAVTGSQSVFGDSHGCGGCVVVVGARCGGEGGEAAALLYWDDGTLGSWGTGALGHWTWSITSGGCGAMVPSRRGES